ncbi:MAG: type II toxin-antitoxin system RelE/ParE family toxin [Candidatus Eisenbacteria bacterium]|uniref:Type II toxin-antitoxin system RelE/ParE family toxin n=1 Tax=Eiseniibacteriota bacterium TaxID=2212470 RepID=A0A7Y2E5E0_UNCEI|nr:type II toxin-antitoxin system RelE/ParE family toxin [Candidatus Eisenbacteria bacterium]
MKVRFTPTGRKQFLDAVRFIREDRPSAAIKFRNRAEKALKRLEEFPDSGRVIPEFPELPFREVVISPYRFFYRVEKRTVWVVGAWHFAQLPNQTVPGKSN